MRICVSEAAQYGTAEQTPYIDVIDVPCNIIVKKYQKQHKRVVQTQGVMRYDVHWCGHTRNGPAVKSWAGGVLSLCYRGAKLVLPGLLCWCYRGVMLVLPGRYAGVTGVLCWCYRGAMLVSPGCYAGVAGVLCWCYRGAMLVLPRCKASVTRGDMLVLPGCYAGSSLPARIAAWRLLHCRSVCTCWRLMRQPFWSTR